MITLIFFRTFVPDMKKEIRKISGIWDFIGRYKYYFVVSIVVLVVGFLSVWYPVRYFAKRLLV